MMEWAADWGIPINFMKTSVLHLGKAISEPYTVNNISLNTSCEADLKELRNFVTDIQTERQTDRQTKRFIVP
uniref:Reverse transcriptase domain-containing protein n=1 Tax=Haemonchus contortus TaxID=6289 RepID=A0A7I4YHL8_HAECO